MSFRSLKGDSGRSLEEDREELISHVKHGKRRTRSTPVLFDTENRDINATDNQGRTSLYSAVKYGETEMVKYLLDKGANPDIADTSMTFPLHEAIDNAYMDIVQLLIDYDCNVNCQNFLGQTPLIRAALFGDTETVKILIKAGADLNGTDNTGKTALLTGLCEGNEKLCCLLIRNGCDVNIVDVHGQSALYLAVHRSHEPSLVLCQKLWKSGYDFENDCNWLSKDLHRTIIHTGFVSNILQKLGLRKVKLDNDDVDNLCSDIDLLDSSSRMI